MANPGQVFETENIRNVVVVGHGGSGKTHLIDASCFVAGTSRRRGNPGEGHALTLTTPEEVSHGFSMQLTTAHAVWEGTKVNLLDTPGYMDFLGETVAGVRAADAAVVVVSATQGVEVGTEKVWALCEQRKLPRLIFVSMMDHEKADFDTVYEQIKTSLAPNAIPVEIPIGEGEDFRGIINLFSQRSHIYREGTTTGEYDEADIPEELQARFSEWETELQETLATTDEDLLDRYLEGHEITREEAIDAMARAVARRELVPVFCGSAARTYGVRALIRKVVELFPHPGETGGDRAVFTDEDEETLLHADDDAPFAALVFKTSAEPHVGELSYFKVVSGSVQNGYEARNATTGASERLTHLAVPMGKERLEVPHIHAGDIGVVTKLKSTHTNDTLCDGGRPLVVEGAELPRPDTSVALRGASRSDEDKLGEVLNRLHEEDPTFVAEYKPELQQTIARGLGELHLDVQIEKMERKYGVSVETEQPKIAYRETIRRTAEGRGRFKKQTGGRGQFGDCVIRLKPRPRGSGYEFISSIKGGVIPTKYVPSVDRGIQEAAARGIVAGYPVVDFTAECLDGSYHSVDSSDIAFKVAGSMAFRQVAADAKPVLLEPVLEVRVTTPDEFVGDIMGDLNQRSARVQGMDPASGKTTIRALVAEAELYKYASALRSMTQGRAFHTRTFIGYDEVPAQRAKKVIAAAQEE